jgi:hypothetical protein
MINFNVEYRNTNIPIVLPDTETVGQWRWDSIDYLTIHIFQTGYLQGWD